MMTKQELDDYQRLYQGQVPDYTEDDMFKDILDVSFPVDEIAAMTAEERQAIFLKPLKVKFAKSIAVASESNRLLAKHCKPLVKAFPNTWYTLNELMAICASNNNGKSTLVLNAIRETILDGGRVAMVLFEGKLSGIVTDVKDYLLQSGMDPDKADSLIKNNLLPINGNDCGVNWWNFVEFIQERGFLDPTQWDYLVIDNLDNLICRPCGNPQRDRMIIPERANTHIMPVLNAMYCADESTFRTPIIFLKQVKSVPTPEKVGHLVPDLMTNAKSFAMSVSSILYTCKVPYIDAPVRRGNLIERVKVREITGDQYAYAPKQWARIVIGKMRKPCYVPENEAKFVALAKGEKTAKTTVSTEDLDVTLGVQL